MAALLVETGEAIPSAFELAELSMAEKVMVAGDGLFNRMRLLFGPLKIFGVGGYLLADAVYIFKLTPRGCEMVAGNRERSGSRSRPADLLSEYVAQALDRLLRGNIPT